MNTMALILAGGVGSSIALIGYAVSQWRSLAFDPLAPLLPASQKGAKKEKVGLKQQLFDNGKKYGARLRHLRSFREIASPANLSQQLAWAGHPYEMDEEHYFGMQLIAMAVMGFVGTYLGTLFASNLLAAVVMGLVFAGVGIPLSNYRLREQGNKRQHELTLTLPDAVDLISTSVAAGLDIDRAMQQTVENIGGPLREELDRFLSELMIGVPRQQAYHNLMWRNRSDDLHAVVSALLQGQHLGVPVTKTLNEQAEVMRQRRLLRAKEAGAKNFAQDRHDHHARQHAVNFCALSNHPLLLGDRGHWGARESSAAVGGC